jgi:hypothetical protein
MIHVVAMKCLIGLPLLILFELLGRSRSFKNWRVGVVVESFVYRLHNPGFWGTFSGKYVPYEMGNTAHFMVYVLKEHYCTLFFVHSLIFCIINHVSTISNLSLASY